MATPVELPYYAPSASLPAPLPSISEIHASPHTLSDLIGIRVVVVADHFVVKYGKTLHLIEAQNLLFVREATSVSVPCVYAAFVDQKTSIRYIIMQRVEGRSLKEEWQTLISEEKNKVCHTLKSYVDQLRRLPSPAAYCSIGKFHLLDIFFYSDEQSIHQFQGTCGPFKSEDDLNEAVIASYESAKLPIHKANFYRRVFPVALSAHPPTFSHANLCRENIIIHKSNAHSTQFQLTLLSWQASGWYPCYWEYAKAFFLETWEDDWKLHLGKILKTYPIEASWINTMLCEMYS